MRNEPAACRSGRNLSAKLVLAAVVHQVTCNSCPAAGGPDEAKSNSNKCNGKGAHDAHSDTSGGGGGGGLRRLGRLLFSNRRRARQPTCFERRLIDSNNNSNSNSNNNSLGEQGAASANDTKADEASADQVIEFKFDLIVEDHLAQSLAADGHRAPADANQAAQVGGAWKLGENIDELVESFVLDSNDVCLMSLGRPAETVISHLGQREWRAAAGLATSSAPGHFQYASSLAAHTLAYSFQLLDTAAGERRRRDCRRRDRHRRHHHHLRRHQDQFHHQQARSGESESDGGGGGDSDNDEQHAEANYYSIELGATLFACDDDDDDDATNRSSPNRFSIVDLLGDSSQEDNAQTVDCSSLEQALETLQALTSRLGQQTAAAKRLLIFHLRLKQRINGGLFSNRMCVIDFQPKFVELHPILESIFNGQALAYLKQRPQNPAGPGRAAAAANEAGAEPAGPKHHQAASLESRQRRSGGQALLAQAEWALYKHLSAALIRTLVVVHVRRLAPAELGAGAKPQRPAADQLMLDNLCLLEFAHSIQRAAAQRLRRRKRHLRSHLASSTTSVASNQSATTTTAATCLVSDRRLLGLLQPSSTMRRKAADQLDQTGSRSLRSRCQRRAMEVGLAGRHHHHHRGGACHRRLQANLSGPELTGTESSSLSTTSSGSQHQQQHQRLQSHRAKGYATATPVSLTNVHSDDSDSVTSANLNSCSSMASYLLQQSSSARCRPAPVQARAQVVLEPWSVTEVERAQIELASALNLAGACRGAQQQAPAARRQTRASSVIQIDCPAPTSPTLTTTGRWRHDRRRRDLGGDNASDIEDSSVVIAEPPKQLKLEEFLTQLSSIISPIRAAKPTAEPTAAKLDHGQPTGDGRQVEAAGGAGEEDEDCKSHSSILEHLSSLALESNTKLRQHHASGHLTADVAEPSGPAPLVQQVEQPEEQHDNVENLQPPATGHLQRLLNSSVQLQRKGSPARVKLLRSQQQPVTQSADIEDRLRALSAAVSPSASSSSGVFAQSSSNCDSTSSCGSSLSSAPPPPPPPPPLPSLAAGKQPDLYASVVNKHHSHIKT